MKKLLLTLTSITLAISCAGGCKKEPTKAEIAAQLEEDIQGFCLNETGMVYGFNDDKYILFSEYISDHGTFEFDGSTLIMNSNVTDATIHPDAEIVSDTLYLTEDETVEFEYITEDEAKKLYDTWMVD